MNTIFKLIILKTVIKYKPIVKSHLFSATSLKLLEYSCNHLLICDENLSLKYVKNVNTSEDKNKVTEVYKAFSLGLTVKIKYN